MTDVDVKTTDPFPFYDAEVKRLREHLAQLGEADWEMPSHCAGWSVKDALRSRPFLLLYVGLIFVSVGAFVPFVHLVPYALDHGIGRSAAALILGAIGVGSAAGRFVLGGVADRIGRRPALVAMFAHKLRGIPYTFTAHARDIYVDTRPELLRAEMEQANAVVTVSEYNRRHLLDQFNLSPNGKLRCIYNGIDPGRFQFRWPRASDPGPPVILSVSRLVEKKGLADLIESANILHQRGRCFQMEIIGEGSLREALQARVRQLGLQDRVNLLGPLPQELVRVAYARAAILALPCVIGADGDRDGIPTVLMEAMASGLPVVSTPVSGIPELIETERDGLLVPVKNPVMLAGALERLLHDPHLRDGLALAARTKIADRFTIDRSCEQLRALFQNGGWR